MIGRPEDPCWHGDVGEEPGLKEVRVRVHGVLEGAAREDKKQEIIK